MCEKHPGQFFGLTVYGSESYFEDNSLSIFNETLPLDKWRVAFKKCDYDNSDSIVREEIPDVVQHLYWGRVPVAQEIDAFMLHFDTSKDGKITWDEFVECLNNFRQSEKPMGVDETVTEFASGEKYRTALRTHTRLNVAPKQLQMRPLTTTNEYGFLAE